MNSEENEPMFLGGDKATWDDLVFKFTYAWTWTQGQRDDFQRSLGCLSIGNVDFVTGMTLDELAGTKDQLKDLDTDDIDAMIEWRIERGI